MSEFLKIKEADNFGKPYYYAERLGIDSVAFILDDGSGRYGLINEYKPPLGRFMLSAFGGSIDSNAALESIVRNEVLEEAGMDALEVIQLGSAFVSTQMNQFCHLYLVKVSSKVAKSPLESNTNVVWLTEREIVCGDDWKAITILSKMKGKTNE